MKIFLNKYLKAESADVLSESAILPVFQQLPHSPPFFSSSSIPPPKVSQPYFPTISTLSLSAALDSRETENVSSSSEPFFAVTLADLDTVVSTPKQDEIGAETRTLFNFYLKFSYTYADSLVKSVRSIAELKRFDFSSAIENELSSRFSPFIKKSSLNWKDFNLDKTANAVGDRTLFKIVQLNNRFRRFIEAGNLKEEDIYLFESTQLGDLNLFGEGFLGDSLFNRIFSDITHSRKETLSALYLAQLVLLDHRQRILIMMLFDKAHIMSVKWDNHRLFSRNAIYQFYVQKGIGIVSNGHPLPHGFWSDCALYSKFLLSFS